jgi:cation diffusion facilitator family transporter
MKYTNLSALKISLVLITSVVAIESTAGLIANSFALLGDASHAAFDSITTAILFLATRWALKPPDRDHAYGHAKIETLGGMIGGILLLLVSFILIFEAASRLVYNNVVVSPGFLGFSAVLYTLTIDFTRIMILRSAGSSLTVKADFLHALSDLASTVVALFGLALANFGYYSGDSFAGIFLGCLLGTLSISLVKRTFLELSDATSIELQSNMRRFILSTAGVAGCKQLRTRKVGEKVYVDATITVSGDLDLSEAHAIASEIESNVANSVTNVDIVVHVEPKHLNLRKERTVRNLARGIKGVKDIHNVKILSLKGGLHLALHAQVDPAIDFRDAHNVAEQLEKRIRDNIKEIKDVFVHLEHYHEITMTAEQLEDPDILRKILAIVARHKEIKALKKSRIYSTEGRLHIYLDCLLDPEQSVEAVHRVLSHVEEELKDAFPNSTVEIHSEPY